MPTDFGWNTETSSGIPRGKNHDGGDMSFSSDVKKELYGIMGNARHCRIAELAALIAFCGKVDRPPEHPGEVTLRFSTAHRGVFDKYLLFLKKLFRFSEDQIIVRDTQRKKTDLYTACTADAETLKKILETTDDGASGGSGAPTVHSVILQRNCCKRAFLRGAFLAAGSVSDPNRSYHFEIVCGTEEAAEGMCAIIRSMDIDARIVRRQRYYVVYVKDSSQISDLLGYMDASVSLLRFENVRIVREVRGGVNRKVNCETANIEKTATAAARQIEDIQYIEKTVGLSKLSKALDEIAQVRLQYPTATLAELGQLLNPPVSKSGVNHRLREISKIAEDLRNTRRQ